MLDTGANHSLAKTPRLLHNVRKAKHMIVQMPNGSESIATSKGNLQLNLLGKTRIIKDVYILPELKLNLLSPQDLQGLGLLLHFEIDDGKLRVQDCKTKDTALLGYRKSDQFFYIYPELFFKSGKHNEQTTVNNVGVSEVTSESQIREDTTLSSIPPAIADQSEMNTLWYHHLNTGHMSFYSLDQLIKQNKLKCQYTGADIKKVKNCETCVAVKTIRTSHTYVRDKPKRVLEVVHSDTSGPWNIGNQKWYITTLLDEFTHYTEIFVSKSHSKQEVRPWIIKTIKRWNNIHAPLGVIFFRADNAPEFPEEEELAPLGIEKMYMAPNSPEQNGIAERLNRTINERIRLVHAPIHDKRVYTLFFKRIVNHALHIINRTPVRSLSGNYPLQLFYSTERRFDIREFGIDVSAKLTSIQDLKKFNLYREKIQPSVVQGFFAGHSNNSNSGTYTVIAQNKVTKNFHIFELTDVSFKSTMRYIHEYIINRRIHEIHTRFPYDTPTDNEAVDFKDGDSAHIDHPNIPHQGDSYNEEEFRIQGESGTETENVHSPSDQHAIEYLTSTDKTKLTQTLQVTNKEGSTHGASDIVEFQKPKSLKELQKGAHPTEDSNHPSSTARSAHSKKRKVEKDYALRDDQLTPTSKRHDALHSSPLIEALINAPIDNAQLSQIPDKLGPTTIVDAPKKARGRPKGSKNKPKVTKPGSTSLPADTTTASKIPKTRTTRNSSKPLSTNESPGRHKRSVNKVLKLERRYDALAKPYANTDTPIPESAQATLNNIKIAICEGVQQVEKTLRESHSPVIANLNHILTRPMAEPQLPSSKRPKVDYSSPHWQQAMRKELDNFKQYGIFTVVAIPKGIRPLPTMWVHTEKENVKGTKHKSRCVALGNHQEANLNYNPNNVSSSVIHAITVRLFTILAVEQDWEIHQLDVSCAYLNAPVDLDVYIYPPKGVHVPKGQCWKLNKALYGLKQSGRLWELEFNKFLESEGFLIDTEARGFFHKRTKSYTLLVCTYVDDILVTGSNPREIVRFKTILGDRFNIKDFGLITDYLGVKYIKTPSGYALSQTHTVKALIEAFPINKEDQYGCHTPYVSDNVLRLFEDSHEEIFEDRETYPLLDAKMTKRYQSGVGSLNWLANSTRPDLTFAVCMLSMKMSAPLTHDYEKLIHCIGYLSKYTDVPLRINKLQGAATKKHDFTVYSDASFNMPVSAKLISGYAFFVNDNLVAWQTRKQGQIQESSMGAELIALKEAITVEKHLKSILDEIKIRVINETVYEDNQAAIKVCHNRKTYHNRRAINVKLRKIHEDMDHIDLRYIRTNLNIADMFTKALPRSKFHQTWNRLKGFRRSEAEVEDP